MLRVEQLTKASEEALVDINTLIHQLSERLPACTLSLLERVVRSPDIEQWVVRDEERIVGIATLVLVVLPEGVRAQLEDIVVHSDYRGKSLGRQLGETLIERARVHGARAITLSSRSDRQAANALYQSLGFEKRDTNLYIMHV